MVSGTDPGPKVRPWAAFQGQPMPNKQRNTALSPVDFCIAVQQSIKTMTALRAYSLYAKGRLRPGVIVSGETV